MRKSALFVLLLWVSGFGSVYGETGNGPIAISPGSETGMANVSQSCPTFSWSAVDQASSYRVSVFQAPDAAVRSYEDMAWSVSPLIVKEIPGPALSWTLPSEERLQSGVRYVWYVQAVDGAGIGFGSSAGRIFKVEQEVACAGMDGKMEAILKSRGVGEDVIAGALNDWKSSISHVSVNSALSQPPARGAGNGAVGATSTYSGKDAGLEGEWNTFYGWGAGSGITTGLFNTFIGYNAGNKTTSANYNTFLGDSAGANNTTGGNNTFVGSASGKTNSTGYDNAFMGNNAGVGNTTGHNNTIFGNNAGYFSTTANFNTFVGNAAGHLNTTGSANTFTGNATGYNNTTGECNTFLGDAAGNRNTTGSYNTFLGRWAGWYNTTGGFNAFIGNNAGSFNTVGNGNAFIGESAGYSNTTGSWNTFHGYRAGYGNTTGYNNTYLGDFAGNNNLTGSGNTFIGNEVGYYETGSNKLYIDNWSTGDPLIYGEFDNNIVNINGKLGVGTKTPGYPVEVSRTGANASIVLNRTDGAKNYVNATLDFGNFGTVNNYPLRLTVNSIARLTLHSDNSLSMKSGASCTAGGVWTNASSIALKENISELGSDEAAATLQALNPVKYNYKAEKDESHVGFIAEEVPELVAMKDRKSLSAMDIVAVLTRVTQDQQNQLREQKQANEKRIRKMLVQQQANQRQIQQIIKKLESEIAELKKNRS